MKRVLFGSLAGLVSLVVAPVMASASPTSGTEHFQLTAVNDQPGAIMARGVFTASGIDYSKSNRDLAVFSDGAFRSTIRGVPTISPSTRRPAW